MEKDIPHELHTITPYLTVHDAIGLIDFLVSAFDAQLVRDKRYANNLIQHARIRIGDSIIMINESNEEYPAIVSQIHLYVEDVNKTYLSALELGAISLMEPNIRPHGDEMAGVKDPHGNVWWIASPKDG